LVFSVEEKREMEKPQTQNRNPNPNTATVHWQHATPERKWEKEITYKR
jgi:hypothetical protein